MKLLAKIAPDRTISFNDEGQIDIHWDDHTFTLDYHTFTALLETLQRAAGCDYADCAACTVVRVDEASREVWINDTCLMLSKREFRALLNAALSTQTRLYGVMRSLPAAPDPLAGIKLRPVGIWGLPRPPRHNLN